MQRLFRLVKEWVLGHKRSAGYSLAGVAVLAGVTFFFLHSPLDARAAQWLWNRSDYAAAYYVNNSNAALAMEEGNYYFGNGAYNLARAAAAYQLALRLQPGILWGHYQLGRIDFVQGRFDAALSELNAEMAANPANLRALYECGLVYTYRLEPGDLARAESDFTRFVAWAPAEWGGYNDLAFVLAKEGKYAQSATVIEQAMQKVPDAQSVPWLWNSLGLAQLNQLDYKQASVSFKKALALAQNVTQAEWDRAYSANDPAVAGQSIDAFKKAIAANLHTVQIGLSL